VAGFLAGAGVEVGDVVAMQLPNWYETVAVALGAYRIGAVLNPMLPVYRAKELRHMLRVGRTSVIFTPGVYRNFDHAALIESLRSELPELREHIVIEPGEPFERTLGSMPAAPIDGRLPRADSVSELIFTSGTEAEPKAIMHTEQTANFSVRTGWRSLGMTGSDVVWMPSPVGHSTGFNYGIRMAVYHGLKLVLQDRWDGDEAADLIESQGCTYTLAATTFLRDVVEACSRRPRNVSSMRLFGCGGSPVPPELVRASARHGIQCLRLYGSTEVLVGTWNRPGSPEAKKVATDGIAVDEVEIQVWAENGRRDLVGEAGEIHARGPNTCVGFFEDPVRTAANFLPDGWVKSGDLAVIDRDGYLTVVGRKKEIIIRGGLNVAPREVEELILKIPGVRAAAVIGLPHERLGEIGCACVVLEAGAELSFDTMVASLRAEGLAAHKLPERLEILSELPMTASGKIRKHVLVAALTGADGSPV
jgi:acyl-coenzyme A synthetase/AMP-(fatty) acid ligase